MASQFHGATQSRIKHGNEAEVLRDQAHWMQRIAACHVVSQVGFAQCPRRAMNLEPERLALGVEKIKTTPLGPERLARERCGVSTELCQRSSDPPRRSTDRAHDDLGLGFDCS